MNIDVVLIHYVFFHEYHGFFSIWIAIHKSRMERVKHHYECVPCVDVKLTSAEKSIGTRDN